MKVFPARQTREQYLATQVARSESKFRYCKVSIHDVEKYKALISNDIARRGAHFEPGPVLCLGTRNGREVDLFRVAFFGSPWRGYGTKLLERRTPYFMSMFPPLEAVGRSDVQNLSPTSVVGVEINPRAARSDIWIGSFDEMPAEWEGGFGVLFSNSFDQSQDPQKTAKEWRRVMRASGYLIFCFSTDAEPRLSDPVGGLRLKDVTDLFGDEPIYYHERGSRNGYSEAIVRSTRV